MLLRWLLRGLAIAICAAMFASTAFAETTFYVAINGEAYVHSERSKTSRNIGELRSGTELVISMDLYKGHLCIPLLDDYGGGLILYDDNYAHGYVDYTMFSLDPPDTYKEKTAIINTGEVAMRYGPGAHYTLIRRYNKDTIVQLVARLQDGSQDWYKVKIGKKVGWIRGDLLDLEEGEE